MSFIQSHYNTTSNVTPRVITVTTGNMKYWSGNVISENHQRPPYLKLSKGNIAIPLNPRNILKNIGNYKKNYINNYYLKINF
jgi:hypothetical protein